MSLISCYRIRFRIPKDKAPLILTLIEEITGPDSIAIGELAEGKMPEKGIENVELLYQHKPNEVQILEIFSSQDIQPSFYEVDTLEDQDWVTASLRELPPVTAGRFYVHGTHCKPEYNTGLIDLEIDAGLAFGTGHHETTEGCLFALSYLSKFFKPKTIADIGTGTGVLAMASVKLWGKKVIATDIDDVAVRVTKSNIQKNNLGPYIRTKTVNGVEDPLVQKNAPYDLLIANILARPLIGMSGSFAKVVAKRGYIILSGLLWRQRDEVYHAYKKHGFVKHKAFRFGGWGCLVLQKGKNL